jgi:hypothetical protein
MIIYMSENKRDIPRVQRCQTEGHPPELPGIYRASSLRSPDAMTGANQIRNRENNKCLNRGNGISGPVQMPWKHF